MENITEHLIGEGPQLLLESDTTYNLSAGITIESTNDDAILNIEGNGNDVTFNIDGIIRSPVNAVYISNTFDYDINIGTTGRLSGERGILLGDVDNASVINNGTIVADSPAGAGVQLIGASANGSITNSSTGTIISSYTGLQVSATALDATVVNDGLIFSEYFGVYYSSDGSFTNNGTIISEVGSGIAIRATGATYLNTGTIISQANDSVAVNMFNPEGEGVNTLFHNSGTISGAMAFTGFTADETFWNSGANAQIIW